MGGGGIHNPCQDYFLDLSNADLFTSGIPSFTACLLSLGFFLFAEDSLTLGLSFSVDLIENGLFVTESLRFEAGSECFCNSTLLFLLCINVQPGLCVKLRNEVGAECELLGRA